MNSKNDILKNIIEYFNMHDFEHYIKIISYIEIDYYEYLKCIFKKKIFKIITNLDEKISYNKGKDETINILAAHFSNHDYRYFLSKLIHNIEGDINYCDYLKCFSTKNIEDIYKIINKHYLLIDLNNILNYSFNHKRNKVNLNYITNILLAQLKEKIINYDMVNKYMSLLNNLYKDEIISINGMELKIIEKIKHETNFYSLLYYGKIMNGSINGKTEVVIKSQPIFPNNIKEYSKFYEYQLENEFEIMTKLNRHCYESITSKIYGHGIVNGLLEGDVDRYILVTELLDDDLDNIDIENSSMVYISEIFIKILRALQTMHNCNLNKGVSFVHSDMKPGNILFTDKTKKNIKLIDFGITSNVFKDNKRDLELRHKGGTSAFMSIAQHKDEIVDYMDDIQAIAWILLKILDTGIYDITNNIYKFKCKFVKEYSNYNLIKEIKSKYLTENNILVIGKICEYTINRADKPNRYSTDKKIGNNYYCDYNEQYYNDVEKLLRMLK